MTNPLVAKPAQGRRAHRAVAHAARHRRRSASPMRPLGRFPVMYLEPFHQSGWRSWAKRLFDLLASLLALRRPGAAARDVVAADQGGLPGPGLLPAAPGGQERSPVRRRQVPHDGPQRRTRCARSSPPSTRPTGRCSRSATTPASPGSGASCARPPSTSCPSCGTCCGARCHWSAPARPCPRRRSCGRPSCGTACGCSPASPACGRCRGRSNTSFDEYSRLDLYYVDNWSLLADLSIMAKTLPSVLLQRGAS